MNERTIYRLLVERRRNIRILKPRFPIVDNHGRPRHHRHISQRFRQEPDNPVMVMNILLTLHEIVDDTLATTVDRFITARVFNEWLGGHIQQ